MQTLLTVILVVTSIVMIVAILLQSGKGSGLAAGFGGASAGTQVFGGSGAGGFLIKVTVVLGALFMIASVGLAYIASQPKSALSGVQSTATSQGAAGQEEQIITRGSGNAGGEAAAPVEAPQVVPVQVPAQEADEAEGSAPAEAAPADEGAPASQDDAP